MARNRIKKVSAPKPVKKRPKRKKGGNSSLFGGLGASAFQLMGNIPFMFYLAFLGVIYISNSHYAFDVVKDIKDIQKELDKIMWESNFKKSELMYERTQTRVEERVHPLGVYELDEPPQKIILPPKE